MIQINMDTPICGEDIIKQMLQDIFNGLISGRSKNFLTEVNNYRPDHRGVYFVDNRIAGELKNKQLRLLKEFNEIGVEKDICINTKALRGLPDNTILVEIGESKEKLEEGKEKPEAYWAPNDISITARFDEQSSSFIYTCFMLQGGRVRPKIINGKKLQGMEDILQKEILGESIKQVRIGESLTDKIKNLGYHAYEAMGINVLHTSTPALTGSIDNDVYDDTVITGDEEQQADDGVDGTVFDSGVEEHPEELNETEPVVQVEDEHEADAKEVSKSHEMVEGEDEKASTLEMDNTNDAEDTGDIPNIDIVQCNEAKPTNDVNNMYEPGSEISTDIDRTKLTFNDGHEALNKSGETPAKKKGILGMSSLNDEDLPF